ncbi:MAG: hypothetical protein HYT98_01665 [Candidatus Sungbacteria bacterium]|nr:hypothetical protein [Candidatus Sungbacteria bacterium]
MYDKDNLPRIFIGVLIVVVGIIFYFYSYWGKPESAAKAFSVVSVSVAIFLGESLRKKLDIRKDFDILLLTTYTLLAILNLVIIWVGFNAD